MKALLLLPLLFTLFPPGQDPAAADENAQVVVVSFKYFKDRQPVDNARRATFDLAPAMIPQNKNFERQRRENASAGDRDPNLDTLDGRGAALEKIVQDSREAPPVAGLDRKSTRLNSSHTVISYAVFCLKKKKDCRRE